MTIYTRSGDKGQTSLIGGKRVSKSSMRVASYGRVDELNSYVGWARLVINTEESKKMISEVHSDLFTLSADLAAVDDIPNLKRIQAVDVTRMEKQIDSLDSQLPILAHFILPGGTEASARLHIARNVARRVERDVVALQENEKVNRYILSYLNRLSDLLFTLARWETFKAGVSDVEWKI